MSSLKTRRLSTPVLLLVLAVGLTARGAAGDGKGQGKGPSSVSVPASIICPTRDCPKNCPYHSKPPRVTIPTPQPTPYQYDAPGRIIRGNRGPTADPTPVPTVPLVPTPGPTIVAAAASAAELPTA